jgi:hypothetical protein
MGLIAFVGISPERTSIRCRDSVHGENEVPASPQVSRRLTRQSQSG